MFYLNPESEKIRNAEEIHFYELSKLLLKRLNTNRYSLGDKEHLTEVVINNLNLILKGKPKELFYFSQEYINRTDKQENLIKRFLKYSGWFDKKAVTYDLYNLAQNLDINTCTYCNRMYTSTVINDSKHKREKISRPQFDHYFLKRKHYILALSFYNLIPSCSICNLIKHDKEFDLDFHLHPYIDNAVDKFAFSYEYDETAKDFLAVKIFKSNCERTEITMKDLKIKEIYNAHTDELRDLIKVSKSFNDTYLNILSENILIGTEIGKEELYQLAFGVYYKNEELTKRPISKFKKDILTELGII